MSTFVRESRNFNQLHPAPAPATRTLVVDPLSAPELQQLGLLPPAVLAIIRSMGLKPEPPHEVILRNAGRCGYGDATYLRKLSEKHPESLAEEGRHLIAVVESPTHVGVQQSYSLSLVRESTIVLPGRSGGPLHMFAAIKLLRTGSPHVLVSAYALEDRVLRKKVADGTFVRVGEV